jgi:hypothetical protein
MKTLRKIFPFFILVCLVGAIFSSCTDKDKEAMPKISHILNADPKAIDSLIVAANAGSSIIIVGENLGSVTEIFFTGEDNLVVPVKNLNPVYITDNAIVLKVPEVSGSTKLITLVTKGGLRVDYAFVIAIPPPVINSFYCEFVPDGGILKIKGNYFLQPKVFFYDEKGELLEAAIEELVNAKEIFVKVPFGATHSKPVVVQNGSGRSESKIFFRDMRNMIVDFDEYRGFGGYLRDWEDEDGLTFPTFNDASPSKYCPEAYLIGEMANQEAFPAGCSGNYNLLNGWDDADWQPRNRIEFHMADSDPDSAPENPRRDHPVLSRSLMGPFLSEYAPQNMVLKFEVYVPKEYPMNGAWLTVFFPHVGASAWDSNSGWGRTDPSKGENSLPLGWWVPFEANIDKTNGGKDDGTWAWNIGKECAKPFHTNDTWMTVSVPLSKVIFHGWVNPGSYLWLGDTGAPYCYDDGCNAALSPGTLSVDPKKCLSDMVVMYSVWSNKGNQAGKFMLFVDNFRLVPEDGGGTVYGRGTGVVSGYEKGGF